MNLSKRFLAFVLAAVMLFSASPLAYAEGTQDEAAVPLVEQEPEEEVSELPETPEAPEAPEAPETPELPVQTPPLSAVQRRLKKEIAEADMAGAISKLAAGKDYIPGQVVALADSPEQAQEIADAYNATLLRYSFGVATLELTDLSVAQAMTLAADEALPLPPVSPNLIYSYGPVTGSLETIDSSAQALEAPQAGDWYTWVREIMENPDPTLLDPTSYNYPWFHDAIHTYAAWSATTGSRDVKVAVIDTGVSSHTGDFGNRLTQINVGFGKEPIYKAPINEENIYINEDNAHGTFVASCIAAAMDNGVGTVGVAPGVSILGYRIADEDGYLVSEAILRAINSAVEEGAWIINMSFGGPICSPMEKYVMERAYDAGITLFASAGNNGNTSIVYPAGLDCTISVASSNPAGVRSAFSTYGSWVDLAAPGTDIPGLMQKGDLTVWDGTSFASPIAAGVAALYMSRMGHVSPAEMKQVMLSSVNPSSDKNIPSGIIDAAKLFAGETSAPDIRILDEDGAELSGSTVTVSVDGSFQLNTQLPDGMLLYTLDGKNPAVQDGEVVSGTLYADSVSFRELTPGTYTLKAAAVNPLGIVSKIASVKLKLVSSRQPAEVVLSAPDALVAGKSTTLSARVLPANADQSVIWEFAADYPGVTLSQKGKLTTSTRFLGDVTVLARSAADPEIWAEHTISIISGAPTASMAMEKTLSLRVYAELENIPYLLNPVCKDASGNVLEAISLTFTSSNPKVASVTEDGEVLPVSAGTATITCRTQDGSNKSASCKVTVLAGVDAVKLTGQTIVAPGASATLKAETLPAKVKNAVTRYWIDNAPEGVTVSAKGVVKVASSVPTGTAFYVYAEVSDGTETAHTAARILVYNKAKNMQVNLDGYYYAMVTPEDKPSDYLMPVEYKQSKGNLTSMTLYSTDGLGYGFYAKLNVMCSGTEYSEYVWSSSNPAVASVDRSGLVLAHANGTAKITCALTDGSKLKKTVTVKVVTPASSVRVQAKENLVKDSLNLLYFGKSANNTAVLGDAFGKPTSKKVTWDYIVTEAGPNGRVDHTDYFHQKKLATVSTSGKVTLSKKAQDFWNYYTDPSSSLYLTVYAVPQFGPKAPDEGTILELGSQYICSVAPTSISLLAVDNDTGRLYPFYGSFVTLDRSAYTGDGGSTYDFRDFVLETDGYYSAFQCTSSNPEIATAYVTYDSDLEAYVLELVTSKKPGTCKVTVFTNDSAKISKTITVNVR